jgi:UDP-N-acetylmuramoylalanine--D-glutamate ligase
MNVKLMELQQKRIVLLGLGQTGMSCLRFLVSNHLSFVVNDNRALSIQLDDVLGKRTDIDVILGYWATDKIAQADVIIASPGIDLTQPELANAIQPDTLIINDIEIFAWLTSSKVVAVTGSNGKSTVVSLLAHVADTLGVKAVLAGNIGIPVLDTLDQQPDVTILELSSFQLEHVSSLRPKAATILNISDDHLDRHKTMAAYQAAKQRIYHRCQHCIVNRDDPLTYCSSQSASGSFGSDLPATGEFGLSEYKGKYYLVKRTFSGLERLVACAELPLAGTHNALNYLATLALGEAMGWPLNRMVDALKSFKGLPHRCEVVETTDGVCWINDSKATNVGATLAAINGLKDRISQVNQLLIILGGEGKGADFSPLVPALNAINSQSICFGKDGQALAQLTNGIIVDDLAQAVATAKQLAKPGDLVLLSPACASIDMFKNYQQRGELFCRYVQEVQHEQ